MKNRIVCLGKIGCLGSHLEIQSLHVLRDIPKQQYQVDNILAKIMGTGNKGPKSVGSLLHALLYGSFMIYTMKLNTYEMFCEVGIQFFLSIQQLEFKNKTNN